MKKAWHTVLFLVICAVILIFFLMAPESTTPRMPADDDHPRRSTDYKACLACHPPTELPADHVLPDGTPPGGKFKCYFCHKRVKTAA